MSGDAVVTKHRTIFEYHHRSYFEDPMFVQVHDRDERWHSLILQHATWQDMGAPETITVTIEPGNLLNS
jgi:hypothetical protein